jgi:protein-S-isoprenylcysteine O-methyltransferase Ste14
MILIRVAKPASRLRNLAKTAAQVALIWTSALYIAPQIITMLERRAGLPVLVPCPIAGWLLFSLASSLGLWSGWTMAWYGEGTPLPLDTARRLVIRGPYPWIRNPMAVAGLAQGAAVGLILGSYSVLLYSLAGVAAWQFGARPIEERDLALRFGQEYQAYRRSVPCWLPRLTPYRPD